MARSRLRRVPRLECLEGRELLSAGGPTPDEQYMLQLINLARTNPQAAASWVQSNLNPETMATLNYYNVNVNQVLNKIASATPQPPVAWNADLAAAAQGHSQDMANTSVQSHTGSDGSTVNQRLTQAGYTNGVKSAENVYGYAESVDDAMEAFLIDWGVADDGHFRNITQPGTPANQAYRDVGIGIVTTNRSNFGPMVVTQDFGSQANEQPMLVGVVFNGSGANAIYQPGQGVGNATIQATNVQTGQTYSTTTWSAGGYELSLPAGTYQVSAVVGGQVYNGPQVTITNVNVEADFNLSQLSPSPAAPAPVQAPPAPASTPAAQAPTPTPPPTPTPTPPAPAPAPSAPALTFSAPILAPVAQTASFNPSWITSWSSWTAPVSQQS
jgi:uncharacterized protein YkwD